MATPERSGASRVIYPDLRHSPPTIDRGQGVFLFDRQGRRYLDGSSGAVVANLGHGLPEIAEAMALQASRAAFVYRTQFSSEPLEQLADLVAGLTPPGFDPHCVFVNSGSEGTEMALKLARQYWLETGRPGKLWAVSRWTSYHGGTLGALSLSGHPARRRLMAPLLHAFPAVPPAYCYRCFAGLTYPGCDLRCATELETAILRLGPERVAVFFAEPIVGASGGAIVPPPGYFERIREICDRHEVLLAADEVMTGFGRTGRNFGLEHWGVLADLIVLGKGLGAGYAALAGVAVTDQVYQAIRSGSGRFAAGHTLANNPLACAVGVAVLRYLIEHDLVRKAAEMGSYLGDRLDAIARRHPSVGEVRGKGLFWGVEFVADRATRRTFPPGSAFTAALVKECFERGLIVYPASGGADGVTGDAILVSPPLVIGKPEVDQLGDLLDGALTAVEARHPAGERGSQP